MAEAEQVQTDNVPATGKRRPVLVMGLTVALLLMTAVCAYALLSLRAAAAATGGRDAPTLEKAELYLPLEPAFVVNFRDNESLRYLQVGVTLMSHDPAAIEVAKGADPVIRDALVSLFSSQDYTIISNTAGRQALQAKALAAVRRIVQARLGRPGIDALYFTSFVMQ